MLLFLLLTFLFLTGQANAVDLQDSVGALYRRDFNNSLSFTCTVSAVDHDSPDLVVLTAKHCVDEKQKHYLVTFDNQKFYNAELYLIPRQHPDDPKEVDMALLKIKDGPGIPKLLVLPSNQVKAGSEIVSVGFPLGVAKLLYKGYVAGRVDSKGHDMEGSLILQTFGAPGSSGTSVVDEASGKIIGVFVAVSASFGTPVMYATPIEYMKYLVTPAEKRKIQRDNK